MLFFYGPLAYGQKSYPAKSQLNEALFKTTKQIDGVYTSTRWFTNGSDSSYKKADTLIFYNNQGFVFEKQMCEYVTWNFHMRDAFFMQRIQRCIFPVSASEVEEEDQYTYEVSENQQSLILQVFNDENKVVDKFEILSLTKQLFRHTKNEASDVLTLRRIKWDETK